MTWRKGHRLTRVRESEATGGVRDIYEESKRDLGLPYVDSVFQVFAAYPRFLKLQWTTFKPVVETGEFFEIVERLRADAYTRAHNYLKIQNIADRIAKLSLSHTDQQEINKVIDISLYGRPLLLLMMAAQLQAFEMEVGQRNSDNTAAHHPVFREAPALVEEGQAAPEVRHVFEELKRNLEMPFVPGEYRALARWPGFLHVYWQIMKDAVASPVYEGCHNALKESAFALARNLPGPIRLAIPDLIEAGMNDSDVTSVVRITELFVNSLSASVLNIAVAKIGMEGGTGVRQQCGEQAEEAA